MESKTTVYVTKAFRLSKKEFIEKLQVAIPVTANMSVVIDINKDGSADVEITGGWEQTQDAPQ